MFSSTKIQEFEGANWDHDLSKEAEDGQLWQDDWDDDDTNDDFTQQLRQQIESTASSTATATTAAPATR
jgi:26 proteasome complex subunit DSS1